MVKQFFQIVVQLLLAGIFIISGVTKLMTYNDFVYFIYGELDGSLYLIDLLGFLLIVLEIVIGVHFLLLSRSRNLVIGTIVFIILLSSFVYLYPTENCHCFGTMFKFNTAETLLKNGGILLLLISLLTLFKFDFVYLWKRKALLITTVVAFTVLAIIQPPQLLAELIYGRPTLQGNHEQKSAEYFTALRKYELNSDKAIAILASPNCKYCITEMKKINKLLEKYEMASMCKCLVFGIEKDSLTFNNDMNRLGLKTHLLDVRDFNLLTQGKLPSVLFTNKDKVYYMRGVEVNETVIQEFKKMK